MNTFSQQQNEFIDIIIKKSVCISKSLLQVFIKLIFVIIVTTKTFVYCPIISFLTFCYSRFQHVSHFLLSSSYLDLILLIPSARLSVRFDNELAINLTLSINSVL